MESYRRDEQGDYENLTKLHDLFTPLLLILDEIEKNKTESDNFESDISTCVSVLYLDIFSYDLRTSYNLVGKLVKRIDPVLSVLFSEAPYGLLCSNYYALEEAKEKLSELEDQLLSHIEFYGEDYLSQEGIKKIKLKLSVKAIAALFHFLHKIGKLEIPERGKKDFARSITSIFRSTNDKEDISPNSFLKNFYSPSPSAIREWDTHFINLRQYTQEKIK